MELTAGDIGLLDHPTLGGDEADTVHVVHLRGKVLVFIQRLPGEICSLISAGFL
jgi:hypothetical protein